MRYLNGRAIKKPAPLGNLFETIGSTADAVRYIIEDPALPKITGLIIELQKIEQPRRTTTTTTPTPPRVPGIGLNKLVTPLKGFVYIRRNPLAGYALLGGILSVPFPIGYLVGRRRKA